MTLAGDDWAQVMARRDAAARLDPRDAELVRARAELDRERALRREAEGQLALFDPVAEARRRAPCGR